LVWVKKGGVELWGNSAFKGVGENFPGCRRGEKNLSRSGVGGRRVNGADWKGREPFHSLRGEIHFASKRMGGGAILLRKGE